MSVQGDSSETPLDEQRARSAAPEEREAARRRTEQRLRESVELAHGILEVVPAGVMKFSLDGAVLHANTEAQRVLGLSWESLSRRFIRDWEPETIHEDGRPFPASDYPVSKCLQSSQRQPPVTIGVRRPDGRVTWAVYIAVPIFEGATGRLTGAVVTFYDITEQKRAEEALRESESRYRDLVENAHDLVQSVGPDGRFLFVNRAWLKALGYAEADLPNLSVFQVIHPDSQAHCREIFARLMAGETVADIQATFVTRAGRSLELEGRATARRAGGRVIATHAIFRDVAERKQARLALERAEAKYRGIFENAVEGIFQSTPEGRFLTANPALAAMLGYSSPDDFIATVRDIPRQLYADPERRANYALLLEGDGVVHGFECRFVRKDGSRIWVALSARAVRDPAGTLLLYEGTVQNITARKQLEEQLIQSQKMEAVGKLAGGVAHDFNNLLTVINGYSEVLSYQLAPDDPVREMVREIQKAGERAASLTRQLLAFSRKQILQPQTLNLNALVAELEKLLRRLIGEDVVLSTRLAADLEKITADPGQIEQVILNLAVNSRDAMPRGGDLVLDTGNVELDGVAGYPEIPPGRYVVLTIRDTGCGMNAAVRSHLFEPFFTTKEMGKGTGLGLATVYGIVRQSGGYIGVESELGRGSTFRLYFPRSADADPPGKPASGEIRQSQPGTETVLLVEDDDDVRSLLCRNLKAHGYTVLEARDAAEALRLAAVCQEPIHLLATDVVMPGMSGRQLADRLSVLCPQTKVLFMSGYTDDAILRHGVNRNGTAFLQKPFTVAALIRKVRAVLEGEG